MRFRRPDTPDCRNEKVVYAWRYMPVPGWGLVVKMDEKELFQFINKIRKQYLFGVLLLTILVIVLALLVSNSISGPIKNLKEK